MRPLSATAWRWLPLAFALLTTTVYCTTTPPGSVACGTVLDGLTHGQFDMEIQFSRSTLGANWAGFGPNVLSFEWAIFSDGVLPLGADALACRSQLRALPDIQSWRNMRKLQEGTNSQLALQLGRTYYSVVRATFRSGEQRIAASNGVKVVPQPMDNSPDEAPRLAARGLELASCPLDEATRCQQSQISVADRLSELYGPARYPDEFVFPGPRDDDDDSGDDDEGGAGDYPWIIAPIIGGLLLLICLILLCLALLALLAKGSLPERAPREKKPKQEKEAPMSFVEADEQKNYGMRDNVDAMDATTATVVEFPDTQIRRLSISHQDDALPGAGAAAPKRGRAPHPIMASASSSFRDYRSNINQ